MPFGSGEVKMTIGTRVKWPYGDRRYGWGVIAVLTPTTAYVRFWPWLIQVSLNELEVV